MLLKDMVFDGRYPNMRVDPAWYEARHPLETLPKVEDPIALFRPAPEVVLAPTPPTLAVALVANQPVLTIGPAETGITEIDSYDIYRAVDGGVLLLLAHCQVNRDFLGGIISITNCVLTVLPEHPGDPWTNVIEDCPFTYTDTAVTGGHQYCYEVVANPMGNNQSVAQGPPSAPSPEVCVNTSAGPLWTARVTGVFGSGVGVATSGAGLTSGAYTSEVIVSSPDDVNWTERN